MGKANKPFALQALPDKPAGGLASFDPCGIHGTSQGLSSLVHAELRLLWQPVCPRSWKRELCLTGDPSVLETEVRTHSEVTGSELPEEGGQGTARLPLEICLEETFPLLLQFPEQRGLQREALADAQSLPW